MTTSSWTDGRYSAINRSIYVIRVVLKALFHPATTGPAVTWHSISETDDGFRLC